MNNVTASLAPVSISYMAALRGVKPRKPGTAFTYALANCRTPDLLIGLAASNPEGQFFGLIGDASLCASAAKSATDRQVKNVSFVAGSSGLPMLDYLACDESVQKLTDSERTSLFDLAAQKLKPSGLFAYSYQTYQDSFEALQFIIREFAAEMNLEQAKDFLIEIKKLSGAYLKAHPDMAVKLDQAIAKGMPDDFFMLFEDGVAQSPTFNTLVAMGSKGMTFAGSGHVESNYVELSIPVEAQDIILQCSGNPLCETMKDFTSQSSVRTDIWCKQPAVTSNDPAELFGGFAYGITLPHDKVPVSVDVFGKTVELSAPVYKKLVGLMTMQPISIGDFLQHPDGKDFAAKEVVGALQILAALGIVRPMRGAQEACNISSLAQPRFCGSFNQYIDHIHVDGEKLAMASRVMGDVITVSPRDALVMQALNRAGLANSVSALLPELQRLAKNPASSARVSDVAEPTAETAHQMINDVVNESFVQWYAYGLLEAA